MKIFNRLGAVTLDLLNLKLVMWTAGWTEMFMLGSKFGFGRLINFSDFNLSITYKPIILSYYLLIWFCMRCQSDLVLLIIKCVIMRREKLQTSNYGSTKSVVDQTRKHVLSTLLFLCFKNILIYFIDFFSVIDICYN